MPLLLRWLRAPMVVLFCLAGHVLLAQTQVAGLARITLEDLGYDCQKAAHGVAINADITGLSGAGGAAGLNAFVVVLSWDRGPVFQEAVAGLDTAAWGFYSTDLSLVTTSRQVTVVAAQADSNAPNQSYNLAVVYFSGDPGPLTITPQITTSSLGSRVVAGDGPGPIAMDDPGPLVIDLAVSACTGPADPNGDGMVDLLDVDLFVEMLATGSGTIENDCNGDGAFSFADLVCAYDQVYPLQDPSFVQSSLFDFDASGGGGHLFTDGLMVALFTGGLTDPTALTNGLINPNGAGRANPLAIRDYLAAIAPLCDLDGNGSVSLFTDITMLWLYMAGVRGEPMVTGLIGPGATRTTAADVEAYLANLTD